MIYTNGSWAREGKKDESSFTNAQVSYRILLLISIRNSCVDSLDKNKEDVAHTVQQSLRLYGSIRVVGVTSVEPRL